MKKIIAVSLTLLAILMMTVAAFADTSTIYSDTSVKVYGPLESYAPPGNAVWGTTSVNAVVTYKHPDWPTLNPASWISNTYLIDGNIAGVTWRWFRKTVNLCEGAYNISGTINATADNAEEVWVNGTLFGTDGEVQGSYDNNVEWQTINPYYYVATGDTLNFDFIVRNYAGSNDPYSNPTGLIFNATINYSCPIEVMIDIKPGSDPSCFNNDGSGVIPVAILGSATFDVYDMDVATVSLEGLSVVMKGKADKFLAAYKDVNGDGYLDLVLKFEDVDGTFTKGSGAATLEGNLLDGTPFFGVGDICVTK